MLVEVRLYRFDGEEAFDAQYSLCARDSNDAIDLRDVADVSCDMRRGDNVNEARSNKFQPVQAILRHWLH